MICGRGDPGACAGGDTRCVEVLDEVEIPSIQHFIDQPGTQLRAIPIDMFTQMYGAADAPALRLREVTT